MGDDPISNIDPFGLCDKKKCTAARALVASLGQQLSTAGSAATWTGIGLVTASGIGAIFAPEAAPAEVAGAEGGAGLIEVGGTASRIGSTLTGYASGGALGAAKAFGASYILGKINKAAAGLGASSGVSKSSSAAVGGLLDQSTDGILEMEAACGVN